ncbi:MAG: polysaccharide biosynthesis/export family protein [Parafilimonas sp.]
MVKKGLGLLAALFLILIVYTSCINTRSLTYFNNLPDTSKVELNNINPPQFLIQANDLLQIRIGGENEETVQYLNQSFGAISQDGMLPAFVDSAGNIELPAAGTMHVAGLTKGQAEDVITKAYEPYLKNPHIFLTFAFLHFTVMGEVKLAGNFTAEREKINIFEAIARAGDMTQNAERQRVMLIRQKNEKREIVTLNFNDKSILNSPYYYLEKDDIIYVEPRQTTVISENFARSAGLVATLISLIAVLATIFRK